MRFESEIFVKGTRQGGKKNTHAEKKNMAIFSENLEHALIVHMHSSTKRFGMREVQQHLSVFYLCVFFSGRDCKVTREVTQTAQFIWKSLSATRERQFIIWNSWNSENMLGHIIFLKMPIIITIKMQYAKLTSCNVKTFFPILFCSITIL